MNKIAFLFPGQGSQYVGMGRDIVSEYQEARLVFEEADEVLQTDLSKLCFEGPEEILKLTENTQPAILATSIACLAVFRNKAPQASLVAGLSLGEYSALVAAGALGIEDAIMLVKKRGVLMQEAVPAGKGAMAAIMGLSREAVMDICNDAKAYGIVEPANYNCPGQVVISGERKAVEIAVEGARKAGARRVIDLPVSAPFHSSMLKPAETKMEILLEETRFAEFQIPLISNVTADYISDRRFIKKTLVKQISQPVMWEDSLKRMAGDGVNTFIEIGPGKALSGFVKKTIPGAVVLNICDIPSLHRTLAYLEEAV